MQLTKHTDFAFRVLIYLASLPQDELVTIHEVSELFDISRNHLMKIVNKLTQTGYIESIRGNKGGIRLGCKAQKINLADIVKLMEATLRPVNCHEPQCRLEKHCRLKNVLYEAQNKYIEYLSQFTLTDIAMSPQEILL